MERNGYRDHSSQDSVSEKQDAVFDKYLDEMKPFVLRLSHKSERQKVGLWIKKLCEPPGTAPSGRKTRNLYGQLLLHMLKRGAIDEPFNRRPEAGPLQPLPSYMSIYLDEPTTRKNPTLGFEEDFGREPPDWVRDLGSSASSVLSDIPTSVPQRPRRELNLNSNGGSHIPTLRSTPYGVAGQGERAAYESGYVNGRLRHYQVRQRMPYSSEENLDDEAEHGGRQVSPGRRYGDIMSTELPFSQDYRCVDSGYPSTSPLAKTNHNRLFHHDSKGSLSGSNTYHEEAVLNRSHEREVELKVKMAEAKFHEEKLKLQQQHDVAVQKILDRKNMELEEVKSHYRNKITEMETAIKKHERKAAQMIREANMIKEQRDKQIAELKALAEQTGETAMHDYEKNLNDKMAEFEQEKFEMQKQHTQSIQELLDETNQRLQKMEIEHNQQAAAMNVVIQELEGRVQQLAQESEALQDSKSKLAKAKEELEQQYISQANELKDSKSTLSKLERDYSRMMSEHQSAIQQLQRKTESNIDLLKQEHFQAATKSADAVSDLESHIAQLKQSLQEAEYQRQKQIRELEGAHQQDRLSLEHLHDKKIRAAQVELDQQEAEYQKRIRKLETALRERDDEIVKLSDMQKQQAQQAETALEDFKSQVERNSGKMFDEMKHQMEKVEEDLTRSKSLREKQSKEFARQLEDVRLRHEKEMAELKIVHEQEKANLIRSNQMERDCVLREQEKDKEQQKERLGQRLHEQERTTRERAAKDAKTIAELEQQVRDLREEVIQANSVRKTQIMELGLLREEEKQNFKRQEENLQSRFKSQLEQQKLQLQRAHSAEMEQMLDKTNNRLRQLEEEYDGRSTKTKQVMDNQQDEIGRLKDEHKRYKISQETKLKQTVEKTEGEKAAIKKHHENVIKSLQQDLDSQKTMVRHLEKQCQQTEIEAHEKESQLRVKYEEKLKGLMPSSVKEELDDTIDSLRQQITVLQSRVQMLQEEVDARNKISNSFELSKEHEYSWTQS